MSMRNFTIFAALTVLLSLPLHAQSPEKTDTIQTPNSCTDYLKIKKDMDDLVRKIKVEYAKDLVFIPKFKKAQLSWESYRDTQLDMIFPETDKKTYGMLYPACRCNWLIEMTTHRFDFLLKWISNFDEGDACGGSVNNKKRKSYVKLND